MRAQRLFVIATALAAACSLGVLAHATSAPPPPEPEGFKSTDYRSPVPATLQGARVVTPADAKALYDGRSAVFIDVFPRAPKPPNLPAGTVWRDPKHASIGGASWLPNVGYGVLAPPAAEYLSARLAALTGGDKAKTLVFFCLKDCWMSWNAGKRALALGYTNVVWFPEGTDGWQALGLPLAEVEPVP